MKRICITIALTGALLLAGLSLMAFAHGQGRGGHQWGDFGLRVLEKVKDDIGLTEKQESDMRAMILANKKAMIDLHARKEKLELELKEEMRQDAPDEDKVMTLVDQCGDIRNTMQKNRLKTLLRVKGMLTPEQREKLDAMRDEHKEKRQERRQHRRMQRGNRGHNGPGPRPCQDREAPDQGPEA